MNRNTIVLVTMVFASTAGYAVGTLQIGDVTVEGNRVVIPVVLGGDVGGGVSALDFRLHYNPDLLQPVSATAGATAAQASKQVMASAGQSGEYAVVMMGMNQTTCGQGEVASVVMQRKSDASVSDWGLGIERQTLSALDGSVIPSEAIPYEPPEGATSGDSQQPEKPNQPAKPEPPATANPAAQAPRPPGMAVEAIPAAEEIAQAEAGNAPADAKDWARIRAERESLRAKLPTPEAGIGSEGQPEDKDTPQRELMAAGNDSKRLSDVSSEETAGTRERASDALVKASNGTTQVEDTHPKPSAAKPGGSKGQVASFLGIAAVIALTALGAGILIRRRRLG